jgi:anti-sigma factor RsiW
MTCDLFTEQIGDAVDGALPAADEAALRAHLARCSACRELFDDFVEIRRTAATLERHEPSPRLREAINEHLAFSPAAHRTDWRTLAMAASVALVFGAASWLYVAAHRAAPVDSSAQLANAASELQLAEQHYENAIAALEKLTADKGTRLEPQVAEAIAQSLATADRAIGDSRTALKTQPDSIVAQTSLLEALRMKVGLLQETISLMHEQS